MNLIDQCGYLTFGERSVFFTLFENKDPLNPGFKLGTYRSCREEFAGCFDPSTIHVGYSHQQPGGINHDNFIKFWREIEKRLGLKEAVVHKTQHAHQIVVEVDPFWTTNSTRRSFFTLFLRCGCIFYKGDFDKAFKDYLLAATIIPAINHFLGGNTTPTYEEAQLRSSPTSSYGVYSKFYGKSQDEINGLLVKMFKP